jgi:uncharacterized damage-inducible protein DinB
MPRNGTEKEVPLPPADAVLRSFAIHNRIHLYLLDALPSEAWNMPPPGGKGRTVAALIGHIHKVRQMYFEAARVKSVPAVLEKTFTVTEAKAALTASDIAIRDWLAPILNANAKISGFKPDAWSFVSFLVAHEAHHRGQIVLLAKQLGIPLDKSTSFGLWEGGVR